MYDISAYVKLYYIDHLLGCIAILDELTAISSNAIIPRIDENVYQSTIFRNKNSHELFLKFEDTLQPNQSHKKEIIQSKSRI